jgi:hypothetical protein
VRWPFRWRPGWWSQPFLEQGSGLLRPARARRRRKPIEDEVQVGSAHARDFVQGSRTAWRRQAGGNPVEAITGSQTARAAAGARLHSPTWCVALLLRQIGKKKVYAEKVEQQQCPTSTFGNRVRSRFGLSY